MLYRTLWVFCCFISSLYAQGTQALDQPFILAHREGKMVLAAFLEASGCPWSQRIKEDVLSSPVFLEGLKAIVVFTSVNLCHETNRQRFQDLFHIHELPLLILFNGFQEEIARWGLLTLDPKDYIKKIQLAAHSFEEIGAFLRQPHLIDNPEKIQTLYMHSKLLSSSYYSEQILQIGLEKDPGSFFLLEQYALLLKERSLKDPRIQQIRKRILKKNKEKEAELKMAVLEFEALSAKAKNKKRINKAITPLVEYIKKFKITGRDHVWKVHLMIAQFLFSKQEVKQAQFHIQAALDEAPDAFKANIKSIIDSFCQGDLH